MRDTVLTQNGSIGWRETGLAPAAYGKGAPMSRKLALVAVALASVMFVACSSHDPVEEAESEQRMDEARGGVLAHAPGLVIGDRASDECMEMMQRSADGDESADVETVTACEDVPEWSYALREVGGIGLRPRTRPLATTLDTVCEVAGPAPVCDDRENWPTITG